METSLFHLAELQHSGFLGDSPETDKEIAAFITGSVSQDVNQLGYISITNMPGSRIDTQTTPRTTCSEMLTLVLEVRTPKSYRMLPLGGKDCISQSFKTPSLRSRNIFVDARLQLVKDHDAFVHRQQLQD